MDDADEPFVDTDLGVATARHWATLRSELKQEGFAVLLALLG